MLEPPAPRVPSRVTLVSPTPVAAPVAGVGGSTKAHAAPLPPLSAGADQRRVAVGGERDVRAEFAFSGLARRR